MQVLDEVLEAGCTYWDTADIYFDSEELIGRWYVSTLTGKIVVRNDGGFSLRFKRTGKRDQVFLATKFGFVGYDIDGSPKHAKESVEGSLKKLGVDHIDLYYLHRCVLYVSVAICSYSRREWDRS